MRIDEYWIAQNEIEKILPQEIKKREWERETQMGKLQSLYHIECLHQFSVAEFEKKNKKNELKKKKTTEKRIDCALLLIEIGWWNKVPLTCNRFDTIEKL